MVLSTELRNAIANMYRYWYNNNEEDWSNKKRLSFMKKINDIEYNKCMPSLNKSQLNTIACYWLSNFKYADDLDLHETEMLNLLLPYLENKGIY